ncbi:MAG TPA: class I SAM-dependent methyltransferase [Candidatus Paceibacterota bacterium]|nr:class I SAM-dependent methyltransferase [Candidatus Paceibacterota bacterium]
MATQNGTTKEPAKRTLIIGKTTEGDAIHTSIIRLTRFSAVFQIYSMDVVMRTSETLETFSIVDDERVVYSGRAVVQNLINTGSGLVCEVSLDEGSWRDVDLARIVPSSSAIDGEYENFVQRWQKFYRVQSDFKVVVADMENFLVDLRLWLDQVELKVRSEPMANRLEFEQRIVQELSKPVIRSIDSFIERFEEIAVKLDPEQQPAHRHYLQRQLHPLILCSPFAHRTYYKPLGYAGDYEVVAMMLRHPCEGGSLFAKIINVWLLSQLPAAGHRNRVAYLVRKLVEETLRVQRQGRAARIFNLGCGPAAEVRQFLTEYKCADHADLTLLDFNEETLESLQKTLNEISSKCGRNTPIHLMKKSVNQLLKESSRFVVKGATGQYDFIYCAGLFDYLSDQVCRRLMDVFYEMLAPNGLLLATNVADDMNSSRPFRYSMEYMLDWNLIYRSGKDFAALAPEKASPDHVSVVAENAGVNVFLEVRKPDHG